jgi:hypothetical protein
MIEIRKNLPLGAEAQQHCLADAERRTEYLDGGQLLVLFIGASGKIDLTHAPFAKKLKHLIGTYAPAQAQRCSRNLPRRLPYWLSQKGARTVRSLKERLNFMTQGRIVSANVIQESSAVLHGEPRRSVKEFFDPLPGGSFRGRHCLSLYAAGPFNSR